MSNDTMNRLCVHVDSADGCNVLIALAPATKTPGEIRADVATAVAADKSVNGNYVGIITTLHDRGYDLFEEVVSIDIDY